MRSMLGRRHRHSVDRWHPRGQARDLLAGLKPGTEFTTTILRAGRIVELTAIVP
jgi:hypothetical protein